MLSLDPHRPAVLPRRSTGRLSYRRLRSPTRLPVLQGSRWADCWHRLMGLFSAGFRH